MQKRHIKYLVTLVGVPILFLFQNCSRSNFQAQDSNLETLPVGSGKNAGSAVTAAPTWNLVSYQRAGKVITLPDKSFSFDLRKSVASEDRSCAGDCGDNFLANGKSFCDSFSAEYSEHFNEKSGNVDASFRQLVNAPMAECDADTKILDQEILHQLMINFVSNRNQEETEVTLVFPDNSQMVFHKD